MSKDLTKAFLSYAVFEANMRSSEELCGFRDEYAAFREVMPRLRSLCVVWCFGLRGMF